jgi:hypothetical protein
MPCRYHAQASCLKRSIAEFSEITPAPNPLVLDLSKEWFLLGYVILNIEQQRVHIRHRFLLLAEIVSLR